MNIPYRHLEDKLRIWNLTIAQWALVLLGAGGAFAWGFYISPFSWSVSLFTAVYVAGLPGLGALIAGVSEFDAWLFFRSAWKWWRTPGRYRPGPGPRPDGYVITPPPPTARERGSTVKPIDVEALWES
ncbi:MAG TPA: hypothetical protein VIE64_00435 [Solirubrobacterales bacterium]|jgi:hypothetical protein